MATERQAGIPGGPYVNETPPPREAGVPGGGFLNETTEAAATGATLSLLTLLGVG